MRNRYETRPVWWATLIVGVFLCGFAYWGVTATLQPIASDALRQSQNDPPWEMLGAVVTAIGALLAVGIETKDKEMPLGVAPQGICAGAIVVLGLLLTYAKAEHDRREHEAQEAKLNRDGALLLETSKSAAQLLAQMKNITASMTQVDANFRRRARRLRTASRPSKRRWARPKTMACAVRSPR